nr:WG repeat-containing protein [Leptospira borgpetersenii]
MNLSGELIIPLEYERAEPFREGRGVVQSSETKKWGAVDSSGKLAIPHKFLNGIYFRDGMAVTAEDSSGMGVIDRNGVYMVSPKFESIGRFSEGLARAVDKKTRKYGFINSKGEYEIEPTISYANEFSNGFAAMHDKQSKWGYIDKSGNITIPTKFNSTGDFSEELADVLTHKWGYINKLGDWIIQPAFTRAYPFLNGIADVEIKKKHGLINPKGEFILEPIYNHIDNTLPTLLRVTLSTNPKSPSFEQYFTRNGKLVWSEFKSVPMTSPSPKRKKNDIVIPKDLLADIKERTHKIVSDFSQSDETVRKSISQLTQISWEEVFIKTVDQLDTNWKELGTDLSGELSGALFFWDDTQGNVGLSVCFAIDNNDPDDLLNEFDGGESAVDFDFVFSKVVPACEESERIQSSLKNELLDVLFEKAVAYSLTRTDFLKIKKMDPLYIYRAYAHNEPPTILFKVGKNKPEILDAKGFIQRRILKDHPYFSQIFGKEEWAEQYQDKFNEISQDDLAETLNHFLFTYWKEESKPEYIKAIAELLPIASKTVRSNRLRLVLAGYFSIDKKPELALQHLRELKEEEHLSTHFLWAREYFSSLEENPEFKEIVQRVKAMGR